MAQIGTRLKSVLICFVHHTPSLTTPRAAVPVRCHEFEKRLGRAVVRILSEADLEAHGGICPVTVDIPRIKARVAAEEEDAEEDAEVAAAG